MILAVLIIFVLGALSLDVGLWYFAHRDAQNDADAGALAGALKLPTDDSGKQSVIDAVSDILQANGAERAVEGSCPTSDDHSYVQFGSKNSDSQYTSITVCTRRQIPGMLASLSGVSFVHISGKATVLVGHADVTNVMPWAVVPPQPTCGPGETCTTASGTTCDFQTCPYGIDERQLVVFKVAGGDAVAPGNFGAILACGKPNSYEDCVGGALSATQFFSVGGNVSVGSDTGTNANQTNGGLEERYADETDHSICDFPVMPSVPLGTVSQATYDSMRAKYTADNAGICAHRLVLVPIIEWVDNGKTILHVLGVATFAIVGWDRDSPYDNAQGTSSIVCGGTLPKKPPPTFACGSVWGFFVRDAVPPDFLLEKIGGDNPFGPLLIALTN